MAKTDSFINTLCLEGKVFNKPKLKDITIFGEPDAVFEFVLEFKTIRRQIDNSTKPYSQYIKCEAYGDMALIMNKQIKKGDFIVGQGHIENSRYTTKHGDEVDEIRFVIDTFRIVDTKGK